MYWYLPVRKQDRNYSVVSKWEDGGEIYHRYEDADKKGGAAHP